MAETIDEQRQMAKGEWFIAGGNHVLWLCEFNKVEPFAFFQGVELANLKTVVAAHNAALLAVAREQREQAFDEAIDVVMEIRTDAPAWKEQAVESLTAIRNSGETSNEG